jgi:Raf kinase inhibitor-like YbhB/YbcL family protein
MAITISSTAFKEGEHIPVKFTGDGRNVSPPIAWSGVPANTASLALVVHDPDATRPGGFTHWVIFDLPADSNGLPEGVPIKEWLENGAIQGRNDGGRQGYMGPAPPPGKPHHYHFRLYALDQLLRLRGVAGRQQVLESIKGHILAEAELVGLYQR